LSKFKDNFKYVIALNKRVGMGLHLVAGDVNNLVEDFHFLVESGFKSFKISVPRKYELTKDEMIDMFHQRSKEHGLKITPQRTIIYQELVKAKDHPTADDIYKRIVKKIPNISFDTVNRTLLTFTRIGITNIVEGYGQPKRYDPDMDVHHHFRCIQCNSIIDFHNKEFDNITVPEEINKQFTVINKKVVLEGLCSKCRRR